MTEFKPNNMVMVTVLNKGLYLPSIYELLAIVHLDYVCGTKTQNSKRPKIPFFGVENVIASVRFNMKSRGIRKDGGQLRNVVAIDLQHAGKNIHLKISSKKIVLVGALTETMGNNAFQVVIDHLKMVQEHWVHIMSLPYELRKTSVGWLCNLLCDNETGKLKVLETLDDPFSNLPDNVDLRCVKYLSMFAHEFLTYIEFLYKLEAILTITNPIYNELPILGSSIISNSIFNYKVGFRISLIKLSQGLHTRGYGVSYHNWKDSKKLAVMVPYTVSTISKELTEELSPDSPNLKLPDAKDLPLPSLDSINSSPTSSTSEEVVEDILPSDLSSSGDLTSDSITSEENTQPTSNIVKSNKKKIMAHRFTIYQGGAIRQSSPCPQYYAEQAMLALVRDIKEIIT